VDKAVLRLEAIRKSYNPGTPVEVEVLHGIDLELREREFCALMGPSGSGKSTLLNIMGLLDQPTGGRLYLDGSEATGLDDRALTRLRGHSIGFVFQYHHLIPAFTAHENVLMPMLLDRGRPDAAMRSRADQLLESVGLARWRDNLANKMSGGQQQRVAVARALAMDPPLLLADEPTGNLDTRSAQGVFDLMREVSRARGTTVLVVTHNHAFAEQCDRIIELVDGQIVSERRLSAPRTAG
jgi:lipoprotein-releasing system ATP-binding protein